MWTAIGTAIAAIVTGLVGWWWTQRKERKADEERIKAIVRPIDDARKAEQVKARARTSRASLRRLKRLQRASREAKLTLRDGDTNAGSGEGR